MANRLEQIDAWLDGTLDDTDAAALEQLVVDDADFVALFTERSFLHDRLRHQYTLASTAAVSSPVRAASAGRPHRLRITPIAYALAAALLLSAAAVALYVFAVSAPDPPAPSEFTPLATLIETSGDGKLTTPHDYPSEGSQYGAGEYTLSANDASGGGAAEFMLTNAVNVKLRGPTRIVMHDNMRVSLMHGRAVFACPAGVNGFTVDLPDGSRVVDLGTRFVVDIDDQGRRSVQVLDGRVQIIPPATGAASGPIVLDAGQRAAGDASTSSMRLDPDGANLILNAGFESGTRRNVMYEMRPTELGPNTAQFIESYATIDTAAPDWQSTPRVYYMRGVASDGQYMAQIDCNLPNQVLAQGGVSLTAGTTYTLTFDLLATAVSDLPLNVRITDGDPLDPTDGTNAAIVLAEHLTDGGDGAWETVTVQFTPPVTAAYALQFYLSRAGLGLEHMYLDDVSLKPTPPSEPDP